MNKGCLPLLIFSLGLAPSLSAHPYTLQYGGRLSGNSGRPVVGPLTLTVNFFNAATGNTLLGSQSFAGVGVTDGLFSLSIDLSPAAFESVFSSSEVWIEVVDNTNGKIYPRQKFGAVPFAFKVPTDGLTLGYNAQGKLQVQGLGPAALPSGNPSDGQILKWKDGTGWEWGADNAGGSGAGSVDAAAILDGSIANADIAAGAAIAGSKIVPNFGAQNIATTGTITGDGSGLTNLPAGPLGTSIDGSEIAAGSISDSHVAAGAAIAQSKISGLSAALAAREGSIAAGTAAQYYRGDKTWATLDTSAVPENVNLYYTDGRARAAFSAVAPLSYNSTTGEFTITSASGVSAGTISAAEFLSFSAKQAAITAASTVNTGTLTTALQTGVEINPFGSNVGESGELRFKELAASGANYVGFKAPDTIASDKVYVLPALDGSVGQFLSTDGAGNLSWGSVGGAAGGTVTSITAGTGLSGGTITGSGTINLANTAVTPGSYTRSNITVDAQGRITAAANGSQVNLASEVRGALPLTSGGTGATTAGDARTALGLGGLSTQSAINLASETTGTLALASGGTGATTAGAARTALGLGGLSTQNAVNLGTETTGTLALASGGTGATTAAAARTSLGLGGLATLSAVGSSEITDASIANADIAAAAGIVDSKLDTISTAGKVSNSATTATSANTASAIVARDPSGDFSAGTITATLIGNASTATTAGSISGTVAIANGGTGATTAALARTALGLGTLATANSIDLATSTTGSLSITSGGTGATTAGAARTNLGLGGLATLSAVGAGEITDDSIANADISASAGIVDTKLATISTAGKVSNSATTAASANTASAIVARDVSGNFSAGTITATLSGNATSATTAGNVSGTIAIANGGTGATTAELARTALGLGSLATLSAVGSSEITDASIANADIAASAAIDATKIADGSVSSAEFQYINTLTSNAQTQIDAKATSASPVFTGQITSALGSAGAPAYSFTGDLNNGIYSSTADTLNFATAGTNRMTIAPDGKIGLNQPTPLEQLHLEGSILLKPYRYLSSNLYYDAAWKYVENGYGMQLYFDGAGGAYFASAGNNAAGAGAAASPATVFTITNEGKIGFGGITTPQETFHMGGNILVKPNTYISSNLYYSAGSWKYNENGYGGLMKYNSAGGISFETAGNNVSGAAAAASPSEKMVLSNAGNLGIGTTNPGSKLTVAGETAIAYDAGSGGPAAKITLTNQNASSSKTQISFDNTSAASGWSVGSDYDGNNGDNFWVYGGGSGNFRLLINSSGQVGIGTTNPTETLHVSKSGYPVIRVEETLSGTNNGALLELARGGQASGYAVTKYMTGATEIWQTGLRSGDDRFYFRANDSNNRMVIEAGGNVGIGVTLPSHILHINGQGRATNSAWATTSDIRLKDVQGPFEGYGLNEIKQIETIRFRYKKDNPLNLPWREEHIGVSAQQLQTLIPDAVTLQDDGYLTVNTDPVFWTMVNSVKELAEENEKIKAESAQLKVESAQLKADGERKDADIKQLKAESSQLKQFICSQFPAAEMCSQ